MIWLALAIFAVLSICVWLFKLLNMRNIDENIAEERKKFFPAQLKPPKAPGQPRQKIKE